MTGSCQVDSPQGITRAGKPSKRLGFSAHARGNILNTNVTCEVIMGAKADPIRAQNEQNPSSRFCIVVGKSSQVQM